jgi:hypothetical protein
LFDIVGDGMYEQQKGNKQNKQSLSHFVTSDTGAIPLSWNSEEQGSVWNYVHIRRMALFLEETLCNGLQ